MKALQFVLAAICGSFYVSCNKEYNHSIEQEDFLQWEGTKGFFQETESGDPYFVTIDDINAYVSMLIMSGHKSKDDILSIKPYGENEISFYVVSYTTGWEMISSDKRGPIFLAKNESGSFEDSLNADYVKIWIGSLMQDIYVRRRLDNLTGRNVSDYVKQREMESVSFWNAINPNSPVVYMITPTTKVDPGLPIITIPDGHWELASTDYHVNQRDTIGHLCEKKWNQWAPYNYYCPPAIVNNGNCPAGCVAISGSQMLKFLHDKIGVPVSAPLSIDSFGCGYNYSPDAWNLMDVNDNIAAMLIRDVGYKVGMFYWYDGSSAQTEDLVDNVFLPYGINSTYGNYNPSIVSTSLMNRMPVIVGAYGEQNNVLGFNINSRGHAFIVDKCIIADCTVTSTFHWVWNPHTMPLPEHEDSISVTGALVFEQIGMNWGWNSDEDDLLFSSMGSWEVDLGDASFPDVVHFDYEREMISGFNAL